ncbi:MAG: hypothetical protein IT288_01535 [Bdellovibrionales bacterium]|nr:hypothetical protein [Bdellovibrionales bacterium]
MKQLLLIMMVVTSTTAWGFEKVQAKFRGDAIFANSTQYYMSYCADKACKTFVTPTVTELQSEQTILLVMDEVGKRLRQHRHASGYEIDGWSLDPVNQSEMFEVLGTDHSNGDGSPAWTPHEQAQLKGYLKKFSGKLALYRFNLQENYMSGTGITTYFFIFNQSNNWVTVLEKLEYAE